MEHVTALRCLICSRRYRPDEVRYVCPLHGQEGILEVEYDYEAAAAAWERPAGRLARPETLARQGMFAYRPLLPLAAGMEPPPLLVGATPLYNARRLAAELGLAELWIKDDGRNPTASLKDRASAVAVMKARELGAEIITTASTGNAAAALAGLAAAAGQQTVIFVPASAPPAKIAQLQVYGATVLLVEGSYDDAFELCLEASDAFGWYCRNTGYNPYMSEGKKTAVFELYDQLWPQSDEPEQPLSHIFVSVGDGCIIGSVYKGLYDLRALGLLAEMPQIMGVQAAGSAYLYRAWQEGADVLTYPPISAKTVADSISAGLPRDRLKAMRAVQESGGAFIQVSDEEILQAIPALAQGSGVFAEPAAAAAYAGLLRARQDGLLGPDARAAVLVTGNGLKDVGAVQKLGGRARRVQPALADVRRALDELGENEADA